jgi:hypothetical protein
MWNSKFGELSFTLFQDVRASTYKLIKVNGLYVRARTNEVNVTNTYNLEAFTFATNFWLSTSGGQTTPNLTNLFLAY